MEQELSQQMILREIYLPAFEEAVTQAQPWTVMCAYNRLNGIYLSDHREMLTTILKEEWGHTGLVVTDWGAMNDRVEALKAGCELEMPASAGLTDRLIVAAVHEGRLAEAVLAARPDAVVALQNGSPVELPFLRRCRAILECYLGGQAAPGGKLAESFPLRLEDNPSHPWFPGTPRQVQYREGIWVGYRHYATAGMPVAFPFGHGLSYTSFAYAGLSLTGAAQLYVAPVNPTVHRPALELKGFAKVWLEPGQSATLNIELGQRAFAFWDAASRGWMVESGACRILVGASSADLRLEAALEIAGTGAPARPAPELEAYRHPERGAAAYGDRAFAALLGRPVPAAMPVRPFHRGSTLGEVRSSFPGRILRNQATAGMLGTMATDADPVLRKMYTRIVDEMPLRGLRKLLGRRRG
jgi:beta-glucosidase